MNLTDISAHWVALHEALGLGSPIVDEAQYAQALAQRFAVPMEVWVAPQAVDG